ncbi:MAG: phosphatase PAP2 family protein [Candidatus Dormibacteria bacterium]
MATVLISLYVLGIIAFMSARGVRPSPAFFVAVALLAFMVLTRAPAWLAAWLPIFSLVVAYEMLHAVAGASGVAVHYEAVIRADRWLGARHLPTLWLQRSLYTPGHVGVLDIAATLVYFAHFPYPSALGYLFWRRDRAGFRRYAIALMAMTLAAFLFYLLYPVAPPWLASEQGRLPHVVKIIDLVVRGGASSMYHRLDANTVAAFPSVHVAFPALGLLFGARILGKQAWPLLLWLILVVFSVVYLGEHYVVDALAGAVLAAIFFAAVVGLCRIPTPDVQPSGAPLAGIGGAPQR